jgi:hypothetical protein
LQRLDWLYHRTIQQLLSSATASALFAVLLIMLARRLPTWAVGGLVLLAAADLGSVLWRTGRTLLRTRRLAAEGDAQPAAAHARLLPVSWLLTEAWLLLAAAALVWRLAYLGLPFLPLALPDLRSLIWGLGVGLGGALALWLLGRLRPLRRGPLSTGSLPFARLDERVLWAIYSALSTELFLRGALQPTLGWPATSILAGAAYIVLFWRAPVKGWNVVLAVASAALGLAFEATGILWAPWLGHALIAFTLLTLIS